MGLWMASLTFGSKALIGINLALEHQAACEAAFYFRRTCPVASLSCNGQRVKVSTGPGYEHSIHG